MWGRKKTQSLCRSHINLKNAFQYIIDAGKYCLIPFI